MEGLGLVKGGDECNQLHDRGSYKVRVMGMVKGLRRAETGATGCTTQAATT